MSLILEFATKKKGKKKNYKKGYPCGRSCINQMRNCRAPLRGQGKTYAEWLKKHTASAKRKLKGNQKLADDGKTKYPTLGEQKPKKETKVKDVHEMTQKEWVKKVVGDVPKRDYKTLKDAIDKASNLSQSGKVVIQDLDNSRIYTTVSDGKNGWKVVESFDQGFSTGKDIPKTIIMESFKKGRLQVSVEESKAAQAVGLESKIYLKADGKSSDRKARKRDTDIAKKIHRDNVKDALDKGLTVSDRVLKDYPDLKPQVQEKEYDRFTKKPGETVREWLERRSKDPEVIQQQRERDQQRFRAATGRIPDRPRWEIGDSGLGGSKRRRRKKS